MNTVDFQDTVQDITTRFKKRGLRPFYKEIFYREEEPNGFQRVHTPILLCSDILGKLNEFVDLKTANIGVLCNPEFVDVLTDEFGVDGKNITFFADSEQKRFAVEQMFKANVSGQIYLRGRNIIMPKTVKKFDVIVMNPPYQPPVKASVGGSGSRNVIWPEFVKLATGLVAEDGYIAAVHPPKWRKPEDEMFVDMKKQNILHLEMYGEREGRALFGASTAYDWYVMQKSKYGGKTTIRDYENNRKVIDLRDFDFLPNCQYDIVAPLLAKQGQEKCEVLFSYLFHETRKTWMHETETKKFCYPCIHTTNMTEGVRYWYSSKQGGYFGTPKYIFGESRYIANGIVDDEGKYGITQQAIAIPIASKAEGEAMKAALESKRFNDLLQQSLRWSQFRIDWRMFRHFRKDFWKDFA